MLRDDPPQVCFPGRGRRICAIIWGDAASARELGEIPCDQLHDEGPRRRSRRDLVSHEGVPRCPHLTCLGDHDHVLCLQVHSRNLVMHLEVEARCRTDEEHQPVDQLRNLTLIEPSREGSHFALQPSLEVRVRPVGALLRGREASARRVHRQDGSGTPGSMCEDPDVAIRGEDPREVSPSLRDGLVVSRIWILELESPAGSQLPREGPPPPSFDAADQRPPRRLAVLPAPPPPPEQQQGGDDEHYEQQDDDQGQEWTALGPL
mmetsp:Transcript_58468/g.148205  ORF Transcript_58468/g.148205 Transcript_58468/m.148205 type:complete len:262 (-) Transcript_58468:531-1316(-)